MVPGRRSRLHSETECNIRATRPFEKTTGICFSAVTPLMCFTRASDQTENDWMRRYELITDCGPRLRFQFWAWHNHLQRMLDPFSDEQHSTEVAITRTRQ